MNDGSVRTVPFNPANPANHDLMAQMHDNGLAEPSQDLNSEGGITHGELGIEGGQLSNDNSTYELPHNNVTDPDDESKRILGKFKNQEELEKAYLELQSAHTKKSQELKDNQPISEVPVNERVADVNMDGNAVNYLTEKGINHKALEAEFQRTGKLSEDAYKMLESKGINREMVNNYIEGNRALAAPQIAKIKEIAGGEEGYAKVIQWAGTNKTDDYKLAFNKILETANTPAIELAVKGLMYEYEAANGTLPGQVIRGGTPRYEPTSDIYTSWPEAYKDLHSTRYDSDGEFRKMVDAKIGRSPNL